MTLAEAIKAELEKYSPGTWVLPDDLDALAEVCGAAIRRLFEGVEWLRPSGPLKYEVERPLEPEDLPFGDDIAKAFEDYESDP